MVHSRASLQRGQALSAHSVQAPSGVTLSGRAKRNRISSISDAGNLRKKRKIENLETPSQYRFPLRSRPNKSSVELVSSDQKRETSITGIPQPKHATQNTGETHTQQRGPPQTNDKRILRSQDGGSRSKSELSLYFTNYEQMLSLEPAKPDLLTAKTHITLIDDIPSEKYSSPLLSNGTLKIHDPDPFGAHKPLHNARRVDLSLNPQGHPPRRPLKDSLPEDIFHKAHRKAERHEKQLRNIEKERAQHEKVQLDRLLEELRGPDWLKVMGISGVTESEKKVYEPKRVFFIKEVAALIEKFRHWKEEEKRRRMEREQAMLAEEEDEEEEEEEEEEEDDDEENDDEPSEEEIDELAHPPSLISVARAVVPRTKHPETTTTTTDVDAAAARQLHQEAISASSTSSSLPRTKLYLRNPKPPPNHIPKTKRDPASSKPHVATAVKPRSGGRSNNTLAPVTLAFGEPIPELPEGEEREFELPATVLSKDMIRARARLRRRLRRGSPE